MYTILGKTILSKVQNGVISSASTRSPIRFFFSKDPPKTTRKSAVDDRRENSLRMIKEELEKRGQHMDQRSKEYKIGMRHLANMMNEDPITFTQEDADAAIEYLFPIRLTDKRALPVMRPPQEIYGINAESHFDENNRPYHYLFYTGSPNYYSLLHDITENMDKLNALESKGIREQRDPARVINVDGTKWMTREQLQERLRENISEKAHGTFLLSISHLMQHPYAYEVEEFIKEYRTAITSTQTDFSFIVEPSMGEDGRSYVTMNGAINNAMAEVTVISPGTGIVDINGDDISYFEAMSPRRQLLFPLQFTGFVNKVDFIATVKGGGFTIVKQAEAGAIRLALSKCLACFVDFEVVKEMKVAGLLSFNPRKSERKKPGQDGARAKKTKYSHNK